MYHHVQERRKLPWTGLGPRLEKPATRCWWHCGCNSPSSWYIPEDDEPTACSDHKIAWAHRCRVSPQSDNLIGHFAIPKKWPSFTGLDFCWCPSCPTITETSKIGVNHFDRFTQSRQRVIPECTGGLSTTADDLRASSICKLSSPLGKSRRIY